MGCPTVISRLELQGCFKVLDVRFLTEAKLLFFQYEKFHQNVAEFIGREGKKCTSVLDDDDVLNYIHELKDERDNAQNRLEDVLMEKVSLTGLEIMGGHHCGGGTFQSIFILFD